LPAHKSDLGQLKFARAQMSTRYSHGHTSRKDLTTIRSFRFIFRDVRVAFEDALARLMHELLHPRNYALNKSPAPVHESNRYCS
jgi:hypothetical protein